MFGSLSNELENRRDNGFHVGFDEINIRACRQSFLLVGFAGIARIENNRSLRIKFAQTAAQFKTAPVGKPAVEQIQIKMPVLRRPEGFADTAREHHVNVRKPEQCAQHIAGVLVIFRIQNGKPFS